MRINSVQNKSVLSLVIIAIFLAFIAILGVMGCQSEPTAKQDARSNDGRPGVLSVLATTSMVADVVRGVGGDLVDVSTLLRPGVDPHLHRTTRDDIARIMKADVVFYSGLMLEGKMAIRLKEVGANKPVYAITSDLEESQLSDDTEQPGHPDPHVWFDVQLWGKTSEGVAKKLSEILPQHAERFSKAAADYQSDLEKLHTYAKQSLASVPREQRILITSHDAFGYLGRAYDVTVMGVQGISTDSEAGLQRVNELVDLLVDKKIPAVFVESSVSPKSIQALMDGARSRGHQVTIGGELFSDAAGEDGTYEGTYAGMIDHNITLVTRALGGDAPQSGLAGKLSPSKH